MTRPHRHHDLPDAPTPHHIVVQRLACSLLIVHLWLLVGCDRPGGEQEPMPSSQQARNLIPGETGIADLEETLGVWTLRGTDQPFTGAAVERFRGGDLARSREFKEGILQAEEEWLKGNSKKSETLYRDGQAYFQTLWRADGSKKIETGLRDGLPHGPHKRWHPNGKLGWVGEFYEGEFHGLVEDRDENGVLILKGRYDKGILVEDLLSTE